MDQKAFVEGGRAFAPLVRDADRRHAHAGDEAAHGLVSLLTPVVKGFLTDKGFEATVQAQQIFGGHGYIEETGVTPVRPRRPHRDDLRGRQRRAGPRPRRPQARPGRRQADHGLLREIKDFVKENEADERLKADFLDPLKAASKDLQAAADFFLAQRQDPQRRPRRLDRLPPPLRPRLPRLPVGADGQGRACRHRRLSAAKLATGRYYMARQLPATALHLARIQSGAEPVMALSEEAF